MTTFSLALLPGDGIGVEVTDAAVRVLRAVEPQLDDVRFELRSLPAGAGEYLRSGDPLPPATFEACQESDAIFLGAMGLPDVRWPNGVEMAPQVDLRERLDLYCGLRPIHLFHPSHSPLKGYEAGEIDFLLIRESTEGLFSSRGRPADPAADEVRDTLLVTRAGSERLFRAAFDHARRSRGLCTLVDKANILPSMAYFRRVFDQVAAEFPAVRAERVYVDAAALYLVQRPQTFNVLVTENMFGDILSDLAAGLVGGMGMAPSADVGDRHAVFQPAHGTAPDIAGQGIANPVAAILSLSMLLSWLAHPETERAARAVFAAVKQVLADPEHRTPDLGGRLGTSALTDLVLSALRPLLSPSPAVPA